MPNWFDTLKQQKEAGRDSITAVEGIDGIPEDASPDQAWVVPLTIKKITPRLTVDGQTYYWLLVKDRMGYAFSIVVWDHQWDDLGPFVEGEKRELKVRVPKGDYSAWNLI